MHRFNGAHSFEETHACVLKLVSTRLIKRSTFSFRNSFYDSVSLKFFELKKILIFEVGIVRKNTNILRNINYAVYLVR